MPIVKRRLDICGRERAWEYLIEHSGELFQVSARQVGLGEPVFTCTCGACGATGAPGFSPEGHLPACQHINETRRDLNIAREAAARPGY